MSTKPSDDKNKGSGKAPKHDDFHKSHNERAQTEKPQPWNVEPINQTTKPPPRPKQ